MALAVAIASGQNFFGTLASNIMDLATFRRVLFFLSAMPFC